MRLVCGGCWIHHPFSHLVILIREIENEEKETIYFMLTKFANIDAF